MPLTLLDSPALPYALDEESLRLVNSLVTRNDDPVDNTFCEKQLRLLPTVLYSSWNPPAPPGSPGRRKFWAAADVGIFRHSKEPPLVPDTFVALDVEPPPNRQGAYFCWDTHKMPELVVEVVSNREGNELGSKRDKYASWGVEYYAVFDPDHEISDDELQVFVLKNGKFQAMEVPFFPPLGLGLTLWHGEFEAASATYLRWCDESGALLLTADERSAETRRRAAEEVAESKAQAREAVADAQAHAREAVAEAKAQAADAIAQRERLAARLRELGIDPGL